MIYGKRGYFNKHGRLSLIISIIPIILIIVFLTVHGLYFNDTLRSDAEHSFANILFKVVLGLFFFVPIISLYFAEKQNKNQKTITSILGIIISFIDWLILIGYIYFSLFIIT